MVEIKSEQIIAIAIASDIDGAGQRDTRMAPSEALPFWLIYGGDDACDRCGVQFFGWSDLHAALENT